MHAWRAERGRFITKTGDAMAKKKFAVGQRVRVTTQVVASLGSLQIFIPNEVMDLEGEILALLPKGRLSIQFDKLPEAIVIDPASGIQKVTIL